MNDKVMMESTGSIWTNPYKHLDNAHVPVVLANPLKTEAIASVRIRNNEIDARILAIFSELIPLQRATSRRRKSGRYALPSDTEHR
jgi:transposase